MKRKITLTIDSDVYEGLEYLPRKVSVSEIVSFLMRVFVEQAKKGRELTDEEFDALIETAGGKEFVKGVKASLGPTFDQIENGVDTIKKLFTGKKRGKRGT